MVYVVGLSENDAESIKSGKIVLAIFDDMVAVVKSVKKEIKLENVEKVCKELGVNTAAIIELEDKDINSVMLGFVVELTYSDGTKVMVVHKKFEKIIKMLFTVGM